MPSFRCRRGWLCIAMHGQLRRGGPNKALETPARGLNSDRTRAAPEPVGFSGTFQAAAVRFPAGLRHLGLSSWHDASSRRQRACGCLTTSSEWFTMVPLGESSVALQPPLQDSDGCASGGDRHRCAGYLGSQRPSTGWRSTGGGPAGPGTDGAGARTLRRARRYAGRGRRSGGPARWRRFRAPALRSSMPQGG
jgi:hypothetical protein